MLKTIVEVSSKDAKEYFLKNKSYSSIDFPEYIDFTILLDKLSKDLEGKSYKEIGTKKKLDSSDRVNYNLIFNKDGKYDWRPYELINPVLYVLLVNEMTKNENWKLIQKRFEKIKRRSVVECVSLPLVDSKKEPKQSKQILNWWEKIEQKSIELALDFNHIYHTDITNCYGSIYTHSVPWALHSKRRSKKEQRENKLFGNLLDTYLRLMSYGQTNGIPQGSSLMDFIAEIILNYADLLLSLEIKKVKLSDYKILRYRDDYRIFVNNSNDGEVILKLLTETLETLGLKLHSGKTMKSSDIITSSVKEDKLFWLRDKINEETLQKQLLNLYSFSLKFPNSGTLNKELEAIFNVIPKKKTLTEIKVLISIVTNLALNNPRTHPYAISIISKLMGKMKDDNQKKEVFLRVANKFKNIPNTGFLEIWLQRAIIKYDFISYEFTEEICQLLEENSKLELWDLDWLNAKKIKKHFIKDNIILKEKLKDMDKEISIEEVSIFNKNVLSL